jgi:DNA-binding transcriptional regulator YdaS (Cro superfamily)
MSTDALSRAVDAVGGRDAFLAAVNISLRTYASWRRDGVPDTRWAAVAEATGGAVSCGDLALDRAARLSTPPGVSAPAEVVA